MSEHTEASNKARAISRAADLIAAYSTDPRGWDYAITGREVMNSAGTPFEDEAPTIIADAIADILHAAEWLGLDTDDVSQRAWRHYHGERAGDLDKRWIDVPASSIEYHPTDEPVSDGTVTVPIELVRAAICAIEYVAEDLRERAEYDDRDDNSEVGDNRRAEADSYDEDYRALIAIAAKHPEVAA